MRTLVGAAEPEPIPGPRITFDRPETTTTTSVVWWVAPTTTAAALPRETYRTTAYVGTPLREIEE